MEERLFWLGLIMGGYAWVTRYGSKSGRLDTRLAAASWHAIFYALAGFTLTVIALLSIESRLPSGIASSGLLSSRHIIIGLIGSLCASVWGFWRAWRCGTRAEKRKRVLNEDLEWAETVFSAVLLAAVLMYFVVQAFKIPSASMESTLEIGDHLFVNKFLYGARIPLTTKRILRWRPVRRGDVVVFLFPVEDPNETHCGSPQSGKDFIKRVIGLPGDKVQIIEGRVFINDKELAAEPYAQHLDPMRHPPSPFPISSEQYQQLWQNRQLDSRYGDSVRDYFGPVTVPQESYFVMGDNRDHSCDGRYWGPVPNRYLKGKAWILYWPPSRMGKIL